MQNKKPMWLMILITLLCICIEIGIFHMLARFNIITYNNLFDMSIAMIITMVIYYVASGVSLLIRQPRLSMWLAIFTFIFQCIFVFYSKTIFDGFTFVACISGLLSSMTVLNALIELKEKGKVEIFDMFKK